MPRLERKQQQQQQEEEDKTKVAQPDREAFEAKVNAIADAIEKLQKKQKSFQDKIAERSGGKEEFYAKKTELRAQLDELSGKMNELQAKKDEINAVVGNKREEGKAMKDEVKNMKRSLGYTDEKEIDNRIAAIEWKMSTTVLLLKEEKECIKEISTLRRNRPKVAQVKHMEAQAASFDPGMSMKDQLNAVFEEMSKYREAKKKVQEKMTELMEGRKEQLGDMGDVFEAKDAVSKEIQAKIQERNEARDEFRQEERNFNWYLSEQRKVRQEKIAQERQAGQAEYDLRTKQRQIEKLDEQPFVSEMTLIEQSIAFCKTLVTIRGGKKEEEKKDIAHSNKDGEEVLLRKEDREEEFFFAPTKGKKAKAAAKKEEAGPEKAKPIKHNAETFILFDKLKLDAPITTADVPALVEKLEAQYEEYKLKVAEWEEKREDLKKAIMEGMAVEEEKQAEKEAEEAKEEEKPAEE
ncbi:unnamed protein product [Polarella glacialis]|uniref:Uncharacterized protein n=1 Tax=Polarella glacialis TaxID=89957 RepID=A0A813JN11_POLGL|nr:unnamed protein product [Polarella glacialis]